MIPIKAAKISNECILQKDSATPQAEKKTECFCLRKDFDIEMVVMFTGSESYF